MNRRLLPLVAGLAATLLAACGGGSGDAVPTESAKSIQSAAASRGTASPHRVAVTEKIVMQRIDRRLAAATGSVDVWVSLEQNSVAQQHAQLHAAAGLDPTERSTRKSTLSVRQGVLEHKQRVQATQAELVARLIALGGKELARVHMARNAIALRIDAAQLRQVAALTGVSMVRPVINYSLDLSETVPYVGGAAVQAKGVDGTGVTVAVLDSGIDYTHRNLGGDGTAAAYEAAYGADPTDPKNTTTDGLFPTEKVVGGFDFVGEDWPNSARTEDPDPIDLEGHGTHVADIIAGKSKDGKHVGMAPGAKLLAVKVCSAVATSCNGIALLKGIDFALDPNGDGDPSDAVDVINMSLGSSYGQVEDDLTLASTNAVNMGVVVVAAAGNSANLPYVVSSPSISPGVISVAQTQVPSAQAFPLKINAPAAIAGVYPNTQLLDFAPLGSGFGGDVVAVGRGCPAAGTTPEDPYAASPAGKVALIDRGACSISLKVDRAAKAGATAVLLGLVAPGDAVGFSFGGGDTFVPGIVIQQALSLRIKAQLKAGETVNVSVSAASAIPLVGSMASTSARGPSISFQTIKPEIGAPGASLSAEAGTGDGETVFGGTSGATPMVAGAAALLIQKYPSRTPMQIKAMLMNSAETAVYTNPALRPGELAPITRIGGGELRVDRALGQDVVAWNRDSKSAALSFGAVEASDRTALRQTLRIENLGTQDMLFTVTPSFRYADDQASGAVRVLAPSRIRVGARSREDIDVRLLIDATKLPTWTLNGGPGGGDGAALNGPEYDGYITLTSGATKLSVPWHVLPRKAAETSAELEGSRNGPVLKLRNRGVESGDYDVFSLIGVSPRIPRSQLPQPGDNFEVIDLRAVGVRFLEGPTPDDDVLEFAISTNGRRATPNYPAEFDVSIDVDGDGKPDFLVFNAERGGFAATGQNLVFVQDLKTPTAPASAFFFTDADFNSGNVIMDVPMAALGAARGKVLGITVGALDNYYSVTTTDTIGGMRFTPGSARYGVVGNLTDSVPAQGRATVGLTTATLPDTASSESGLLLMYRRNAGTEADIVRVR